MVEEFGKVEKREGNEGVRIVYVWKWWDVWWGRWRGLRERVVE